MPAARGAGESPADERDLDAGELAELARPGVVELLPSSSQRLGRGALTGT